MNFQNIMALDVGSKRVGVAVASSIARLPRPLTTIPASAALDKIAELVKSENIGTVVVGHPRNLNGNETSQTTFTEQFATELSSKIGVPIYRQDEAVTSAKAEEELKSRGKPYNKEDIDSLAATYILEDFLNLNAEGVTDGKV